MEKKLAETQSTLDQLREKYVILKDKWVKITGVRYPT